MEMDLGRCNAKRAVALTFAVAWLGIAQTPVQSPDAAAVIRGIDAAVNARYDNLLGFTDIEHYRVFRGTDETHPVAEMTVKDTYRKGIGKTYTVLSQNGSGFVTKIGLMPLLETERVVNLPGNLQKSWFTSGNYEMKSEGPEQMNGRECLRFDVKARQKASNTIDGSIWVDAKDYTLVQIQGVGTKSPSAFAGVTHMMRQYVEMEGYSMAMHARAESTSLLGRIVVTIEYSDYHLQLQ
jgi:hypothetical protein